jgi:hypothetical protein
MEMCPLSAGNVSPFLCLVSFNDKCSKDSIALRILLISGRFEFPLYNFPCRTKETDTLPIHKHFYRTCIA